MQSGPSSTAQAGAIGFREFVVLVAAMMSCQALAVDAMLPALSQIARELGVTDENRTQWVITAYIAGLGVGQLFWGVLSDRVGRRPILLIGLMLYVAAAVLAGTAIDFTTLILLRFIHGIAASSIVVSRSMIRDLYGGRQMARVMSLTFIVFMIVPIIAPTIGQLVLLVAPWRSLFWVFALFGAVIWLWLLMRMPETLHPEYRMPLTLERIGEAARRVASDRASRWYTLAATVMFGSIIAYVGMVQQIFKDVFHEAALMPSMFALCAAAMCATSFINSRIVERMGMRLVSQAGLLIFIAVAVLHLLICALGVDVLWLFVLLQAITVGCLGLIIANFGAMAMEEMGPVAGIAASLQGCVTTFGGALIATLIGRQYSGSTLALVLGAAVCGVLALLCVLCAERWRLFQPHNPQQKSQSQPCEQS